MQESINDGGQILQMAGVLNLRTAFTGELKDLDTRHAGIHQRRRPDITDGGCPEPADGGYPGSFFLSDYANSRNANSTCILTQASQSIGVALPHNG